MMTASFTQTRMSIGSQLRQSGRAVLVPSSDGRNLYSVDGGEPVGPGEAIELLGLPGFGATPAQVRDAKLAAIMAENPEGNDRVTASIILDAREAAAKRAGCVHSPDRLYAWRAVDGVQCVCCCDCGAVLAGAA